MPIRPPIHRPRHWKPTQRRAEEVRGPGSTTARGYGADWRRVRDQVLRDEPLCRPCTEAGRVTPAVEVDHIFPIRQRPDLRLERSNLRPICRPCHQARTGADGATARRG